jgi:translation initiation factor RLI1
MTGKTALVNYYECHPDKCADGICEAISECPMKLITQEEPYAIPMTDPLACKGCGSCVRACKAKAIKIVTM